MAHNVKSPVAAQVAVGGGGGTAVELLVLAISVSFLRTAIVIAALLNTILGSAATALSSVDGLALLFAIPKTSCVMTQPQ